MRIFFLLLFLFCSFVVADEESVDFLLSGSTYAGLVERKKRDVKVKGHFLSLRESFYITRYIKSDSWLMHEGSDYIIFLYEGPLKQVSWSESKVSYTSHIFLKINMFNEVSFVWFRGKKIRVEDILKGISEMKKDKKE